MSSQPVADNLKIFPCDTCQEGENEAARRARYNLQSLQEHYAKKHLDFYMYRCGCGAQCATPMFATYHMHMATIGSEKGKVLGKQSCRDRNGDSTMSTVPLEMLDLPKMQELQKAVNRSVHRVLSNLRDLPSAFHALIAGGLSQEISNFVPGADVPTKSTNGSGEQKHINDPIRVTNPGGALASSSAYQVATAGHSSHRSERAKTRDREVSRDSRAMKDSREMKESRELRAGSRGIQNTRDAEESVHSRAKSRGASRCRTTTERSIENEKDDRDARRTARGKTSERDLGRRRREDSSDRKNRGLSRGRSCYREVAGEKRRGRSKENSDRVGEQKRADRGRSTSKRRFTEKISSSTKESFEGPLGQEMRHTAGKEREQKGRGWSTERNIDRVEGGGVTEGCQQSGVKLATAGRKDRSRSSGVEKGICRNGESAGRRRFTEVAGSDPLSQEVGNTPDQTVSMHMENTISSYLQEVPVQLSEISLPAPEQAPELNQSPAAQSDASFHWFPQTQNNEHGVPSFKAVADSFKPRDVTRRRDDTRWAPVEKEEPKEEEERVTSSKIGSSSVFSPVVTVQPAVKKPIKIALGGCLSKIVKEADCVIKTEEPEPVTSSFDWAIVEAEKTKTRSPKQKKKTKSADVREVAAKRCEAALPAPVPPVAIGIPMASAVAEPYVTPYTGHPADMVNMQLYQQYQQQHQQQYQHGSGYETYQQHWQDYRAQRMHFYDNNPYEGGHWAGQSNYPYSREDWMRYQQYHQQYQSQQYHHYYQQEQQEEYNGVWLDCSVPQSGENPLTAGGSLLNLMEDLVHTVVTVRAGRDSGLGLEDMLRARSRTPIGEKELESKTSDSPYAQFLWSAPRRKRSLLPAPTASHSSYYYPTDNKLSSGDGNYVSRGLVDQPDPLTADAPPAGISPDIPQQTKVEMIEEEQEKVVQAQSAFCQNSSTTDDESKMFFQDGRLMVEHGPQNQNDVTRQNDVTTTTAVSTPILLEAKTEVIDDELEQVDNTPMYTEVAVPIRTSSQKTDCEMDYDNITDLGLLLVDETDESAFYEDIALEIPLHRDGDRMHRVSPSSPSVSVVPVEYSADEEVAVSSQSSHSIERGDVQLFFSPPPGVKRNSPNDVIKVENDDDDQTEQTASPKITITVPDSMDARSRFAGTLSELNANNPTRKWEKNEHATGGKRRSSGGNNERDARRCENSSPPVPSLPPAPLTRFPVMPPPPPLRRFPVMAPVAQPEPVVDDTDTDIIFVPTPSTSCSAVTSSSRRRRNDQMSGDRDQHRPAREDKRQRRSGGRDREQNSVSRPGSSMQIEFRTDANAGSNSRTVRRDRQDISPERVRPNSRNNNSRSMTRRQERIASPQNLRVETSPRGSRRSYTGFQNSTTSGYMPRGGSNRGAYMPRGGSNRGGGYTPRGGRGRGRAASRGAPRISDRSSSRRRDTYMR